MTVFTEDKMTVIRAVAEHTGLLESPDKNKEGVFYDSATRLIIDTRYKSEYFSGMPKVGFLDEKDFSIEETRAKTCVDIRDAINAGFAKIPKFTPKEHGKATEVKPNEPTKTPNPVPAPKEHPKNIPQTHNEEYNKTYGTVKNNVPTPEAKKADLIPEKVQEVKPELTSKDAIDMFRKEAIDEEQLKHKGMTNESKVPKTQAVSPPAPKPPEPEQKKAVPVKNCKICGFALSGNRAMECFGRDPQEPAFICEECEAKKPEPKEAQIMPPSNRLKQNIPARIPSMATNQSGSMIKGIAPGLAELGKIKIGRKGAVKESTQGKSFRLPEKLDHFEVTGILRDEKGDFVRDPVMDILGEKPTSIDIMLLFNDPTLNFITSYAQYSGGKCMCRGDGESAIMLDGSSVDCNPETCQNFIDKKCKPNGILSVIIAKSPRLGGVYKFRTTSINSIKSILSSLFFLSTQTGGVLSMIPLKMTLSPKQVTPIVKGVPQMVTIYTVNIEFAGTASDLLQKTFEVQKYQSAMRESIIKLEATARKVLTAPETPEEQKDVQEEWYPEQV